MKTKHFEIVFGSTGWIVRPLDPLDNGRWYFNCLSDAKQHMNYLERQINFAA